MKTYDLAKMNGLASLLITEQMCFGSCRFRPGLAVNAVVVVDSDFSSLTGV